MSTEFLLTTLIVVVTPGTGALYTIATGLTRGARASLLATVGCTVGIVPHILAAITGLAALLHASALAFTVVKYLGVAYLLYMAWTTLRDKGALTVDEDSSPSSPARLIGSGVFVNLLNPKLTIFFLAFLPQFVTPARGDVTAQMLALSAVFMVATFLVFAVYGVFASAIRTRLLSRPRVIGWMRRAFGVAFIALAGRLAFAQR